MDLFVFSGLCLIGAALIGSGVAIHGAIKRDFNATVLGFLVTLLAFCVAVYL